MNISVVNANQSRLYTVRSSPNNNNIRFIKNKTLNTRMKRVYVTAEVYFHKKIPAPLLEHMKRKGIKEEEVAYLQYIEIKKNPLRTRRGNISNTFTIIDNNNEMINKTINNHIRYYSTHNKIYTLTKGYGRRLIEYIEESLRREGIRYLYLTPSKTDLRSYYTGLNYIVEEMNNTNRKKNNQNENNQKNSKYLPDNIVMYKDLHIVNE